MTTTKDQQIEIANTIISQLGGFGKLKAMVGMNNTLALESGLQFGFKGSRKINKCVITLTDMDLYEMSFYKNCKITGNEKSVDAMDRKIEKSREVVESFEGVYFDQLKPIFESTTGLNLSL